MQSLNVFTYAERPELEAQRADNRLSWPEFVLHPHDPDGNYTHLKKVFEAFQVYLCDEEDQLVGSGASIPLAWDGRIEDLPESWEAALARGVAGYKENQPPNTLSAVGATVEPGHTGKGYSKHILRAMKTAAIQHGLTHLIAPVRPTWKCRYPLTPMEQYVSWTDAEGLPFDPWIRVHHREGARIVKVIPQAMTIEGTVADWERWTDMRFPDSGDYIVPHALVPVNIDREKDLGRYVEPGVWMVHEGDA